MDRPFYNKEQPEDMFKPPYPKSSNQPQQQQDRQRQTSQSSYNSRENSMERGWNSRENSLDRRNKRPNHFNNRNRDYSSSRENSMERYGNFRDGGASWRSGGESNAANVQKIAELTKQFENAVDLNKSGVLAVPQKSESGKHAKGEDRRILFDPRNPEKPILVTQSNLRPKDPEIREFEAPPSSYNEQQQYSGSAKPAWYNPSSQSYNTVHKKYLIDNVVQCDKILQNFMDSGELFNQWDQANQIREKIQKLQETFLVSEMKFVQEQNLEHFFWKLLFYNLIEMLRKRLGETMSETEKAYLKERLFEVIDCGTKYMESLVVLLEKTYSFSLDAYTGQNAGRECILIYL